MEVTEPALNPFSPCMYYTLSFDLILLYNHFHQTYIKNGKDLDR